MNFYWKKNHNSQRPGGSTPVFWSIGNVGVWRKIPWDACWNRSHPANGYLLVRAQILQETGRIVEAAALYNALAGRRDLRARKQVEYGWLQTLEKLGQYDQELDLMERLLKRQPHDRKLRVRAVRLALRLGRPGQGLTLLTPLLQSEQDDPDVLRLQARCYQLKGREERASTLFQQLVGLVPDDPVANRFLADYYGQNHNPAMELRHVQRLLRQTPDDSRLLLRSARLLQTIGRVDQALERYDLYLEVHPEDTRVVAEKKAAQKELAQSLVVLVEHASPGQLWRDLAQVTSDRVGVYLAMADILRRQGKTRELAMVLRVLHDQGAALDRVDDELRHLRQPQGHQDERQPALPRPAGAGTGKNTDSSVH